MLPILTFLAIGLAGWFAPTPSLHDKNSAICSTNAAPIGASLLLYYDKTHRGVVCRVAGTIPSKPGHLVNVSESVRNKLGFRGLTTLRVYRIIGQLQPCTVSPPPATCKTPPAACVAHVPDLSLVVCI
jgi:hypothetical protein